jgi:lipoprotein-anchoring transpeptidase ErfK/SrfK
MKVATLAVTCLVAAASAAAVKSQSGPSTSPAKATSPRVTASVAQLPAVAADGRIFLTTAQQRQAIASGTIDRPVKSLLAVEAPLRYGEYKWNDRGIPAGLTWVRIDLGTQLMSVFRAGHEIGTAVVVYGGDNKETPTGKLHILGKARNHRSSLYDAEMPYTLRLTNDGVSIHGSSVRWGAATHGCIGVPLDFAERLFDATMIGDEVVIIPVSGRSTRQRSS